MATLMRCTQPHWQGNKFVDAGTVLPEGHPEAIDPFFETFEVETPETHEELVARAEAAGVKVDKRWGDDRLRAEIASSAAGAKSSE